MARDPQSAMTTLCLAGPPGSGRTALVRALHDGPGDALAGRMATAASMLGTRSRRWRVVDARGEGELLRDLVDGGVESPVALVVVDALDPRATQAASATAGCATMADSTSIVESRWPDTLSTSSTRPRMRR